MTSSRGPAIVMFLVAAFELLLGAGFLLVSLADLAPAASQTFLVLGSVLMLSSVPLLLIGGRFRRRYAQAQHLRRTGVAGTAQVLAARQTGMSVNDQPQVVLDLRITAPGHGTYDAVVKEFVPFIALGLLGTGRPLTVLVDPQDRQKILVDWSFGPAGAAPAAAAPAAMDPGVAARIKAQILATGVPGTARVLSAEFAGSLDEQSRPVYSVQLHIQIEGRAPMAGPAVFAVPLERVAVMHPGGVIPIKADPYDPTKFAADWDRLAASQ